MAIDRKEYLKEYFQKNKERIRLRKKLLREERKNPSKSMLKERSDRSQEPYKYKRKNEDLFRQRERSTENILTSRTKPIVLFDAMDFCMIKILLNNNELQSYRLFNLIGVSQMNGCYHVKRLKLIGFVDFRREKQKKYYFCTDFGKAYMMIFGDKIRSYLLETRDKKLKNRNHRSMLMDLLIKNGN